MKCKDARNTLVDEPKRDLPNFEQVPKHYAGIKFTPLQLPARRLTDVDNQLFTGLVKVLASEIRHILRVFTRS